MENEKYTLTDERREIKTWSGRRAIVYRIIAIKDFEVHAIERKVRYCGDKRTVIYEVVVKQIKAGQFGGYVESKANLSQSGKAWVDEGVVFDEAVVKDDSWVGGKKTAICGKVVICDSSKVFSDNDYDLEDGSAYQASINGRIKVCGYSKIMAPVRGEGVIKDRLINRSIIVKPKLSQAPQTIVRFECSVGDKKIAKKYAL